MKRTVQLTPQARERMNAHIAFLEEGVQQFRELERTGRWPIHYRAAVEKNLRDIAKLRQELDAGSVVVDDRFVEWDKDDDEPGDEAWAHVITASTPSVEHGCRHPNHATNECPHCDR